MKQTLVYLLDKEMDRKEFLRYIGAGMLLLVGGGMILRAFGLDDINKNSIPNGYGANTYGLKK